MSGSPYDRFFDRARHEFTQVGTRCTSVLHTPGVDPLLRELLAAHRYDLDLEAEAHIMFGSPSRALTPAASTCPGDSP